ncbi:hypothetical protein [Dyadobacter pollutisoli]|uniref:Uncharacterized protein n=1 Tax=Dyadobacter pollutisoli TaxID=2910158 RepID=A0A9E8NFZ8_9BACT|nr:hypothetical protein [Dyadobacter pollutisoli]WAC14593.1 hypothetical protein ON006_11655 [Dyadobacter pollutisoli]
MDASTEARYLHVVTHIHAWYPGLKPWVGGVFFFLVRAAWRNWQGNSRNLLGIAGACLLFFAKDDASLFAKAKDAAKKVIDSKAYALHPQFQEIFMEHE